jgi:hypothetical protein
MKSNILFPYLFEDDNRNAFAFTVELARRSNADIITLTSLELEQYPAKNKKKLEEIITDKKNQIYCNLLEMQGYYHGRFNQWNAFDEVKIHSRLVNNDMNAAICSAIRENTDLVVVLQQRYFSGTGLYEEIFSNSFEGNVTFFILPKDNELLEPSPNLLGVMFYQQKRAAFIQLLHETKTFDLPEDSDEFKEEMIMQQTV